LIGSFQTLSHHCSASVQTSERYSSRRLLPLASCHLSPIEIEVIPNQSRDRHASFTALSGARRGAARAHGGTGRVHRRRRRGAAGAGGRGGAAAVQAWRSEHRRPRCNCGQAGEEDRLRLEVFRANLRYIDAHNAEADAGLHTFRLGLTPFADLTLEEFVRRALGFRNATAPRAASTRYLPRAGDDLPDAVDWRLAGAVTEVKNQRHCGSYPYAQTPS